MSKNYLFFLKNHNAVNEVESEKVAFKAKVPDLSERTQSTGLSTHNANLTQEKFRAS